jgi:hypothetical protein
MQRSTSDRSARRAANDARVVAPVKFRVQSPPLGLARIVLGPRHDLFLDYLAASRARLAGGGFGNGGMFDRNFGS